MSVYEYMKNNGFFNSNHWISADYHGSRVMVHKFLITIKLLELL